MANFRVDTDGNLWIGTNISNDFATAKTEAKTKFYVEKDGTIKATAGTIGGIVIDADGIESDNYDVSTNTGWRLDNTTGIAQYFDINIILDGNLSDNPSSGVTTLDLGNSQIYDFLGDLTLKGDNVRIKASDESSNNPSLTFAQAYDNPGFYGDDSTVGVAKLYLSNGNANILHTESDDTYLHIDATNINFPSGGLGANGEVIGKTANGLEWVTAGGTHPDSDHTSFLTSIPSEYLTESEGDSRYVNESDHSHSSLASQSSVDSLSTSLINHTGHGYMSFTLAASSGGSSTISNGNTLGIYAGSRISTVQSGDSVTISTSAIGSISQSGSDGFVTSVSGSTVTTSATKSGTIFTDTYAPISSGGDVGFSFRGVDVFYTSLNSVSDETTKTGIADLTYGLDWINTLRPISYRYDTRTVYVCENDLTDYEYYNSDDTCEHCVNQNTINNFQYQQNLKDFNEGEIETEPTEPTELTTGLVSKEILWGNSKENWGFSAQEIEATLPTDPDLEIVEDDAKPDGSTLKVLDYIQIIAPLVKAVQELSTQVSDLTARIETLEG